MNNLDRFQKVSVEQGVPILFAQVPALDWEGDRYPELELEKRLAEEFQKRGFHVRQLWPAFRGTKVKEFAYDIWHPDETGHRIIAEDLCIYLRGTGLAPRPPEVGEIDSINGKPRRTEP